MSYNKQLLEAAEAEKEDHELVLRLIQSGVNVNTKDEYGQTPLLWAAVNGHYDIAKTLLEQGAEINSMSHFKWTPLIAAIDKNQEKVVLLLLEKGANPNFKAGNNGTALENAITCNTKATIVELLLKHGANVHGVQGKRTPLHWACGKGYKKVVELLLHKGASLEARDGNNHKPVDIAKNKNFREIVDVLEKKFLLWLRLYLASEQGNYQECKELLEQDAYIDSSQYGLYCPVRAAIKKGHSQIVKLLLENGANMNYSADSKRNLVILATKLGHKEIVSLLLDAGGNVKVKVNGETLLHVAAINNSEDIVRLLIEKELFNPNIKGNEGCTPLHYATLNGYHDIASCLINASANVNLATDKMETPLHLACQGGHPDIVQFLLEKGASKNALNAQNEKPINIARKRRADIELETKGKLLIFDNIEKLLSTRTAAVNLTTSEPDASNERFSDQGRQSPDIENNEGASDEDYDSDATVDYSHSKKLQCKPDLSCGTLNINDVEELNNKMAELSSLILELNEVAMNVEIVETDLRLETDILRSLDRKLEHARVVKRLKSKNSEAHAQVYEDNILDFTRKMDESKRKEADLRAEVEKLQTDIPQLKARVKSVYREIAIFIEKIKVL